MYLLIKLGLSPSLFSCFYSQAQCRVSSSHEDTVFCLSSRHSMPQGLVRAHRQSPITQLSFAFFQALIPLQFLPHLVAVLCLQYLFFRFCLEFILFLIVGGLVRKSYSTITILFHLKIDSFSLYSPTTGMYLPLLFNFRYQLQIYNIYKHMCYNYFLICNLFIDLE